MCDVCLRLEDFFSAVQGYEFPGDFAPSPYSDVCKQNYGTFLGTLGQAADFCIPTVPPSKQSREGKNEK